MQTLSWIAAIPVLAAAGLFLLSGLVAIFSRRPTRRAQARAVFELLVRHRSDT